MNRLQFQRVILHSRFELSRFEKALFRLEACQFPSNVAIAFIDTQKQENLEAAERLNTIEVDFADDPQGAAARLVSEYRKMMSRRRYLEVLEKASSDEVPWSIVPSIERLAHHLLPDRPVLITTTPDMNYMVSWSRSGAPPMVTIYLPKLHRANAFLHVLIGHELFHPAIESFFPDEKTIIRPRLLEECHKLLSKTNRQPDLFTPQRLDALLNEAMEAWERGLTELMCDMGAASLFGPAALWTISGFAATQDLDIVPSRENQFYPPWRMRIKAVLDYILDIDDGQKIVDKTIIELEKRSLTQHVSAIQKNLAEDRVMCSDTSHPNPMLQDPIVARAYECIEESTTRARTFIREATAKIDDRWVNTSGQVPALLTRLALLVPPSELIDAQQQSISPADLSAIVLACWIERLAAEERGALGLDQYRRLCRLMLKAIDDSELKRQFDKWRNN